MSYRPEGWENPYDVDEIRQIKGLFVEPMSPIELEETLNKVFEDVLIFKNPRVPDEGFDNIFFLAYPTLVNCIYH